MSNDTIDINIGIDFGTSFSKICARDVGAEISKVCDFGGATLQSALIPSLVRIGKNGALYLPTPGKASSRGCEVRYLKMALANPMHLVADSNLDLASLGVQRCIKGLSAAYLCRLLSLAKKEIADSWASRIGSRKVRWSGNVGVPVAYYDSHMLGLFHEVIAVAWVWETQGYAPRTLKEAIERYDQVVVDLAVDEVPCWPFPEIAAAVQSFVSSRAACPGVYIYFDVGGGTVDGVAFRLLREDGFPTINFYSGVVEPYGVMAFAEGIAAKQRSSRSKERIDQIHEILLRQNKITRSEVTALRPYRKELQRLVANVIISAKRKDGRNWREENIQQLDRPHPYWAPRSDENIDPLCIFMGGGACRSAFYLQSIGNTYVDFGHSNAGVPPYRLEQTPSPVELDLQEQSEDDYHRFLVAYGLSVPFGEGPDIGLPSQFEEVPRSPLKGFGPGYDYEDTKAMFD